MAKPVSTAKQGFTLVELMIVVAILGILATIAMVSFAKYSRRAKVAEAYSILGMIRSRQETYRGEFSQYCDVSSGTHDGTSGQAASYWPASSPGRTPANWYTSLPTEWTQLGIRPSGQVYFRYQTVAGNPGVSPSFFGSDLGYSSAPNQDAWWAAHAIGDLDGDGIQSTFEAFSMSSRIWANNENE